MRCVECPCYFWDDYEEMEICHADPNWPAPCEYDNKEFYKCPLWDFHCPYFCQSKEDSDFGLCLMQEMEGCSPVNECEAFDGVDEEDFEV